MQSVNKAGFFSFMSIFYLWKYICNPFVRYYHTVLIYHMVLGIVVVMCKIRFLREIYIHYNDWNIAIGQFNKGQ